MSRQQSPESQILRAILDYCAAERILAYRLNTGVAQFGEGPKRRHVQFGVEGMADIIAFPDGKVLWVEAKSATGRQRPTQKSFQDQVEAHGHGYIIARSSDDLHEWLRGSR